MKFVLMHPDGEFVRVHDGDWSYKWVSDVNRATVYTAKIGRSRDRLEVDPPIDELLLRDHGCTLIPVPVKVESI